jgi:hypothetical protein
MSVLSCYAAEYGNYYLVSDAIAFPALILIPHRNSRKFQHFNKIIVGARHCRALSIPDRDSGEFRRQLPTC